MSNVVYLTRKRDAFKFDIEGVEFIIPFDDVESYVLDGDRSKIPDKCLPLIVGEWFLFKTG